jgi:hypothetical protein
MSDARRHVLIWVTPEFLKSSWNAVLESGGFVVGDEVEITIDVELVRKAE